MSIRAATPDDLDEIASLIRALADYEHLSHEVVWDVDDLGATLFGDGAVPRVLLAETDDGDVAGMALWFPTYSTFLGAAGIWLEDLFVREEHRGHGFGAALLGELRTLTTGRVEWAVLDWNQPSIDFYRSLGAVPVDGWTRYRWTLDPAPVDPA